MHQMGGRSRKTGGMVVLKAAAGILVLMLRSASGWCPPALQSTPGKANLAGFRSDPAAMAGLRRLHGELSCVWPGGKPADDKTVAAGLESAIERNEVVVCRPIANKAVAKSKHFFAGPAAIREVEKLEGTLTPAQKRVVEVEGYVSTLYLDDKGIVTYGVGQTGEFIKKGFKASFKIHEEDLAKQIPSYKNLPDYLKAELMQAAYRGDIGQSPTFRRLFNTGQYEDAAEEFLNNKDYKDRKAKARAKNKDGDGVTKRMEALQKAVRDYGKSKSPMPAVKPGRLT